MTTHGDRPETLYAHIAPLSSATLCEEARRRFAQPEAGRALAVVDDGALTGVLERARLLAALAAPGGREAWADKPIKPLVSAEFTAIEMSELESALANLMIARANHTIDDAFIVTQNGRYLGLGDAPRAAAALMRRLAAEKIAAENSSREKSEFLSMMSHELRTPLNAIIGFSETIVLRALGETPQARAQYASYQHDVLSSGRYLLGLIESLLSVGRAETGARDGEIRPLDFWAELTAASRIIAGLTTAKGVSMRWTPARGVCVHADQQSLRQILLNILGNAAKFAREGGHIDVSAEADGRFLRVDVLDDGPGFRGTASPYDPMVASAKGAGIGFKLSARLAEAQGGALVGHDRPEGGAHVSLWLPRAQSAAAKSA